MLHDASAWMQPPCHTYHFSGLISALVTPQTYLIGMQNKVFAHTVTWVLRLGNLKPDKQAFSTHKRWTWPLHQAKSYSKQITHHRAFDGQVTIIIKKILCGYDICWFGWIKPNLLKKKMSPHSADAIVTVY